MGTLVRVFSGGLVVEWLVTKNRGIIALGVEGIGVDGLTRGSHPIIRFLMTKYES